MVLFLVMVLSSDYRLTAYGAYATAQEACDARARCEELKLPWQYEMAAERMAMTPLEADDVRHPPRWYRDLEPELAPTYCVAERAVVGQDDAVVTIPCPPEGIYDGR